MRNFIAPALFSAFALGACQSYNTTCISGADAVLVAKGFGQILSSFNQSFGETLIADGYYDQSDSVATLIGTPNLTPEDLGVVTFATKESFLAGEAAQPGVPFELLNTWHNCASVTFRYVLHPSTPSALDVQGIAVAEVKPSSNGTGVGVGMQKWQISAFYGEFNSAVWLTDLASSACNVTASITTAAASGNGTV